MKEVVIPSRERKINALLSSAREEDVLLRTADGSEFLLTAVDDFAQEIVRTRQNEKLMALLEGRRRETDTIPWDQAKRELGLK
jgi:hypothetical protein